jgi:hypothetical protein
MTTFAKKEVVDLVEKATQLFGGSERDPFKALVKKTVQDKLVKDEFTIPEVFELVDMSNAPVSGTVEIGQGEPRTYLKLSFKDFVTRCVAEEMVADDVLEDDVNAALPENLHPSRDIGVSSFDVTLNAASAAGRRKTRKHKRRQRKTRRTRK